MANQGNRLIWLNAQVKVSEYVLVSGWISEVEVLELDSTLGKILMAWLFGIDLRWLFNYTKDKLGSRSSS